MIARFVMYFLNCFIVVDEGDEDSDNDDGGDDDNIDYDSGKENEGVNTKIEHGIIEGKLT